MSSFPRLRRLSDFSIKYYYEERFVMTNVPELFGSMVFNDQKMKERLPHATYKALKKTIQNGEPLDISVATAVANAMKDWAVEMGCTHYTHWFQPMTGVTAEKHDSRSYLWQLPGTGCRMGICRLWLR